MNGMIIPPPPPPPHTHWVYSGIEIISMKHLVTSLTFCFYFILQSVISIIQFTVNTALNSPKLSGWTYNWRSSWWSYSIGTCNFTPIITWDFKKEDQDTITISISITYNRVMNKIETHPPSPLRERSLLVHINTHIANSVWLSNYKYRFASMEQPTLCACILITSLSQM